MSLHPVLSPAVLDLIRSSYGWTLLATLLLSLGPARWFFVSERWRGYAQSSPGVDLIQNPTTLPLVLAAWVACALGLISGQHTVLAAALNLGLCHYFFIHMRWKGNLRGMGAPGFMAHWCGALVLFGEYNRFYAAGHPAQVLALLAFRMDFALIMFSAGIYKLLCGYATNQGMDFGLVNPYWGRWWRFFRTLNPEHPVYAFLNHCAYGTELVAGLMMLVPYPVVQFYGGVIMAASFVLIMAMIRLGCLTQMVILSCLIYVDTATPGDGWVGALMAGSPAPPLHALPWVPYLNNALAAFWVVYMILLVPAHCGLYYNLIAKRSLPGRLQPLLEGWTNSFGIIIWRVFTIDVVNFYVQVSVRDKATGTSTLYSEPGRPTLRTRLRYVHVGEFIALVSVFTTLKYHPNKPQLFRDKLMRYARTVPHRDHEEVVFSYTGIHKQDGAFVWTHLCEMAVDTAQGEVRETYPRDEYYQLIRSGHSVSPVHEGARPGSYVPLHEQPARGASSPPPTVTKG